MIVRASIMSLSLSDSTTTAIGSLAHVQDGTFGSQLEIATDLSLTVVCLKLHDDNAKPSALEQQRSAESANHDRQLSKHSFLNTHTRATKSAASPQELIEAPAGALECKRNTQQD